MIQRLGEWFGGGNRWRLLIVLGSVGILLIGVSEWLDKPRDTPMSDTTVSVNQIEQALEERVASLLSRVEGVGDCYVMVTLEQSTQQVYASQSSASGESVLTVSTDAGPIGLLITEIQPIIKGVVVVCDGGDDSGVRERVTAAVATAFNLSSRRVYVLT